MSSAWSHQQADVGVGAGGDLPDEAELHQILRRDRQRDEVADRLVEAVIRAVLEQEVLLVVGALVEVVAQLVVDGLEIVRVDLDAHLDAQVVDVVDVPGRGMTDDVAIARPRDQRAFPEGLGQRLETRAM